jgi:hypothetical protein
MNGGKALCLIELVPLITRQCNLISGTPRFALNMSHYMLCQRSQHQQRLSSFFQG